MKKELLKNIGISFAVALVTVTVFNLTIAQQQQDALEENIQQNITGLSMNINDKLDQIDKNTQEIKKLKKEIQSLKQDVMYLNQQVNQKIKIKRDNIFITEAMRKLLDQLKQEAEQNLQKQQSQTAKRKVIKFGDDNNKLENEKEKKAVKIKPVKYHITLPDVIKVSRIDKIDNKIYLYLTNGDVLTRGAITNGLKVLRIDTKENIVYMKVIDQYAYEKGKIYKIPYIIQFDKDYGTAPASSTATKPATLKF